MPEPHREPSPDCFSTNHPLRDLPSAQNHPVVPRGAEGPWESTTWDRGYAHPALHVCADLRDPLKRVVLLPPPPPTSSTLEFTHLAPLEASPRGPGFSQSPRRALLP